MFRFVKHPHHCEVVLLQTSILDKTFNAALRLIVEKYYTMRCVTFGFECLSKDYISIISFKNDSYIL